MMQARTTALIVAMMLIGGAMLPAAASAQSTGIDKIHAQVRIGGKVCFSEHAHYGDSDGTYPSRHVAEAQAIRHWAIFVVEEYGRSWGVYANAVAKTMNCTKDQVGWFCKLTARPCRTGK